MFFVCSTTSTQIIPRFTQKQIHFSFFFSDDVDVVAVDSSSFQVWNHLFFPDKCFFSKEFASSL